MPVDDRRFLAYYRSKQHLKSSDFFSLIFINNRTTKKTTQPIGEVVGAMEIRQILKLKEWEWRF